MSFSSLLRFFGTLIVNRQQPVGSHIGKAAPGRSGLDRPKETGRHPSVARPFMNGLDIGPDLSGEDTAGGPAGDQSVNGVFCMHADQNGRFFQKRKMENSSMGIFSKIGTMTA